jgi:hypothetical protein
MLVQYCPYQFRIQVVKDTDAHIPRGHLLIITIRTANRASEYERDKKEFLLKEKWTVDAPIATV